MTALKVAIAGANGRMGRVLVEAIHQHPDTVLSQEHYDKLGQAVDAIATMVTAINNKQAPAFEYQEIQTTLTQWMQDALSEKPEPSPTASDDIASLLSFDSELGDFGNIDDILGDLVPTKASVASSTSSSSPVTTTPSQTSRRASRHGSVLAALAQSMLPDDYTEDDVFEDFSEEERSRLFGKPPATVWENMCGFNKYPEKKAALTSGNILRAEFIDSFAKGALVRWQTELLNRIIPEFHAEIVAMKCLHDTGFYNKCDDELWEKIAALRVMLAKDSVEAPCIFTMIRDAFSRGDFDAASKLKLEMVKMMNLHICLEK